MAVIGGLGSISGTLMGVAVIEVLSYTFPKYQLVLTGVGLLLILLFLPGGLGEGVQSLRDRLLKLVAVRRDILVPSLVADKRVELVDRPPEESSLLEHALSEDGDEDGDGGGPAPPVLVPLPDIRDEDTAPVRGGGQRPRRPRTTA